MKLSLPNIVSNNGNGFNSDLQILETIIGGSHSYLLDAFTHNEI